MRLIIQVVNLQHEFGLFGGPEGRHIARLLEKLKKPVVTTIHTVLQQPTLGYYTSLIEVIQRSQQVVVMSNKAIEILREIYYVPPEMSSWPDGQTAKDRWQRGRGIRLLTKN